MKKLFFVLFVAIATTVNAQSYEQTFKEFPHGDEYLEYSEDSTLTRVQNLGIDLEQYGYQAYEFKIKDPKQSHEFFKWIVANSFFGKMYDNFDFSQTEFSDAYGFRFADNWVIICFVTEKENGQTIMQGSVTGPDKKEWEDEQS